MQATIVNFQNVANPDGHEPAGWRFVFKRNGSVLNTIDKGVSDPSATFEPQMTPGSYTASAQRLNNFGAPIGPEVSSAPLVVSGPETFQAPLTVTLSL